MALVWILGEFGSKIETAPYLLEDIIKSSFDPEFDAPIVGIFKSNEATQQEKSVEKMAQYKLAVRMTKRIIIAEILQIKIGTPPQYD